MTNGGLGSSAEVHDTPKAAVRAAGVGGIAHLPVAISGRNWTPKAEEGANFPAKVKIRHMLGS